MCSWQITWELWVGSTRTVFDKLGELKVSSMRTESWIDENWKLNWRELKVELTRTESWIDENWTWFEHSTETLPVTGNSYILARGILKASVRANKMDTCNSVQGWARNSLGKYLKISLDWHYEIVPCDWLRDCRRVTPCDWRSVLFWPLTNRHGLLFIVFLWILNLAHEFKQSNLMKNKIELKW